MTKHADKIAALQADERGEQIQYREVERHNTVAGYWSDCKGNGCPSWDFNNFDFRPKPKRKFVPWTFENCPIGIVVVHKETRSRYIISSVGVRLGVYNADFSFEELFNSYEQLSGQPCGTECEVEG